MDLADVPILGACARAMGVGIAQVATQAGGRATASTANEVRDWACPAHMMIAAETLAGLAGGLM